MKRTVKRRRDFYQYNCRISIKKNTKSTGMAGSDKLDAGLQKIINQALNGILDTDREDNAPVTSEDMEELTSLVIDSGDDVEDLDGLRYAVNLTSLSVYGDIAGLEEIGYLEKLESLSVNQNSGLETLSVFGDKPALADLETLVLNMNNITSTQFCADLPETMRQLRPSWK